MKHIIKVLGILLIMINIGSLNYAHGKPLYVKDIPLRFKDHCTTCHITSSGMGGLNNFGADYYNNGFSVEQILQLDSDSDGYINSKELDEGTFPGDQDSYPGSQPFRMGIDLIVFLITLSIAGIVTFWLFKTKL